MYLGRLVEQAPKRELYREPLHPYTLALLSAAPVPDPRATKNRILLTGDVPSPINPPAGCSFHPRCRESRDLCRVETPALRELLPGRLIACHNR
jgi:oligopeptide/dipeptide ABC transporter ATP-binding protein